jgi:hypothetical protein
MKVGDVLRRLSAPWGPSLAEAEAFLSRHELGVKAVC